MTAPAAGPLRWLLFAAILAGLFGVLFGRSAGKGSVSLEDGFVDIGLPIVEFRREPDGLVLVTARGEVRGRNVGFAVDIVPGWKEQRTDAREIVFYWGWARLRSIGAQSDAFVRLLAELYARPAPRAVMPDRVDAEAAGLLNDPALVLEHPTKMKLFFRPDSEQDYAEVFLNIDIPEKKLEFREKDPEYREPLLRALGAES